MTAPLSAAAVLALGYLLGAVPFAFILGSAAGVDLRTVGTGNVGAGNLRRTVGIGPAVAAAVLDGCWPGACYGGSASARSGGGRGRLCGTQLVLTCGPGPAGWRRLSA